MWLQVCSTNLSSPHRRFNHDCGFCCCHLVDLLRDLREAVYGTCSTRAAVSDGAEGAHLRDLREAVYGTCSTRAAVSNGAEGAHGRTGETGEGGTRHVQKQRCLTVRTGAARRPDRGICVDLTEAACGERMCVFSRDRGTDTVLYRLRKHERATARRRPPNSGCGGLRPSGR